MSLSRQSKWDVASGIVVLGGIAAAVAGAEIGAPVIAGLGAVATAGAGIVRVVVAPHHASASSIREREKRKRDRAQVA